MHAQMHGYCSDSRASYNILLDSKDLSQFVAQILEVAAEIVKLCAEVNKITQKWARCSTLKDRQDVCCICMLSLSAVCKWVAAL